MLRFRLHGIIKHLKNTGDTHYSIMRGTKSDLIIKQGAEEEYKPTLYIVSNGQDMETNLRSAFKNEVSNHFEGTTLEKIGKTTWRVDVPDVYKIGHEAHFGQVTENYLKYLEEGKLPHWEVPNMITKYYTTIEALKKAGSN